MSEVLTYDSLLTDVQTYCERSDDPFVAQIPRFLMLAENRLASEVRGLGFERYVTGTMNSISFPKPNRWRETISLCIVLASGNRKFLFPRSVDYLRAYNPNNSTGEPRFYADYGFEHYMIAPVPVSAFNFELAYYERPEPLSAEVQTNWTTQYAPQLLLYATLLEAQPFLKRPDLAQVWQGAYDRALQGLGNETTRQYQDRTQGARSSV